MNGPFEIENSNEIE